VLLCNSFFTAVLLFVIAGTASATLITFQESPQVSGATPPTNGDIISNGFLFDSSTDHTHFVNNFGGGDSGSTFFGSDDFAGVSTTTMTQVGGDAFNLLNLDLGNWFEKSSVLQITGYFSGGGSISTDIALGNFTTYVLNWNNINSLVFDSLSGAGDQYWGVDNINVSAVPVPAAAWLFGSALLGFFGFSRKKANA